MNNLINKIETSEFLGLNAKLQQKKNDLRTMLKEKGTLKKDRRNIFDKYDYFSEAGYKKLFTELFAANKLELSATVLKAEDLEGSDKMPFAKRVTLLINLHDTETGFYESCEFVGEALDRGDKAIYKAYTGALKYYYATIFSVATGDDPETESPSGARQQAQNKYTQQKKQEPKEPELLDMPSAKKLIDEMELKGVTVERIKKAYKVDKIIELNIKQAAAIYKQLEAMPDKKEELRQVNLNEL